MANPTTNYSFVLPTSTDLVTDLPADFDVALQGVDTRLKALQPGTTAGDLAYSSATANTNLRLGIGSTGNILTVAGGVPVWAASGTLPIMRSTGVGATFTTTSVTFVDQTGYTLTFTPVSATNKITISVDFQYSVSTTGANVEWQILRGATVLFYRASAVAASGQYQNIHYEITDTNVAASSQTYKLQVRINGGFTYTNFNDTIGFTGSQIRSLEVY